MKTIKKAFLYLFLFFFLFTNYNSLFFEFISDKKLANGDSVSALAKDITSEASCDLDVFGGLIESSNQDTQHEFMCDHRRKNAHFSIYIFTTQVAKKEFLEADSKTKHYFQQTFKRYYNPKHEINLTKGQPDFYNPCFKQGDYYVVCENARWDESDIPQYNGEPYYHEFKGEDIEWKIPSSIKKD